MAAPARLQPQTRRYALGLDFGTESVRALVVDRDTGEEVALAVSPYAHGVITERLPGSEGPLPADFALQHPDDYVDSALEAIREALCEVPAAAIVGIGVDFTACTMLPVLRDGTPLMKLPRFRGEPHAWVKLWKHHAAQTEADRIGEVARERGERFLDYYSGAVSSEWMLPKCWEILRKAPEVYEAAGLLIDAGDWFVHRMTGVFTRNSCAAGYKGLWSAEHGFPSRELLAALDPRLAGVAGKWVTEVIAPGMRAGSVSREFAALSGLIEGTPVSAATIDAHSGVAGMGVYREGPMSIIMGTSSCHMALSRELKLFDGFAGVVRDGIIPGFHGYESGQCAVGDIFGWFARHFHADAGKPEAFESLSAKARALKPGAGGLVALDWMNGNRSVLMNSALSGVILGLRLDTRPEQVYRALIEATAFGTRKIIEAHREGGVPVHELVVCGGLVKDPLILKIYADVTGLPVKVAASSQAVALGAAIFGALAAEPQGGAAAPMPVERALSLERRQAALAQAVEGAIVRMTLPPIRCYLPDGAAKEAYDRLYGIYLAAHDHFGKNPAGLDLMMKLKESL